MENNFNEKENIEINQYSEEEYTEVEEVENKEEGDNEATENKFITLDKAVVDLLFDQYSLNMNFGEHYKEEIPENYPGIITKMCFYSKDYNGYICTLKENLITYTLQANYGLYPIAEISVISNNPNFIEYSFLRTIVLQEGKVERAVDFMGTDEENLTNFKAKLYKNAVGLIDYFEPKAQNSLQYFNAIKQFLHKDVPKLECFNNLGYYSKLNYFVFYNGFVDLEDNSFYEFIGEDKSVRHKDGGEYCLSDAIKEKICLNTKVDGKTVAKEYFKAVKDTFQDVSMQVALLTVLGTAFADIFWQKQGMPIILFSGKSQTGKSLLQYSIAAIFGMLNSNDFASGSSTIKAFRNELEKYCNIPVFIEELIEERMKELPVICKDIFSKIPRKTSTQSGKTLTQSVNTVFCACSNAFIPELTSETLSRIVFTDTKDRLSNISTFPFVSYEELSKLSSILIEILKFRARVVPLYDKSFEIISQTIGSEKRLGNNLAIAMTMATIINNICNETIFDITTIISDYITFYQQYLFSEGDQLDSIFFDLEKCIREDRLIYGEDYKLSHDSTLRLKLNNFLEKYNSLNKTKHTKDAFKLILGRSSKVDIKAKATNGLKGRAISINISNSPELVEFVQEKRVDFKKVEENQEKCEKDNAEQLEKLGIAKGATI